STNTNNPQLSTLNSQLSTLNSQLSTLNSQLSTLNSTLNSPLNFQLKLSRVNSQVPALSAHQRELRLESCDLRLQSFVRVRPAARSARSPRASALPRRRCVRAA